MTQYKAFNDALQRLCVHLSSDQFNERLRCAWRTKKKKKPIAKDNFKKKYNLATVKV